MVKTTQQSYLWPVKTALLPPSCLSALWFCPLAACLPPPTFVLEPGVRGFNLGWQVRKETKCLQSNHLKDLWEAPWWTHLSAIWHCSSGTSWQLHGASGGWFVGSEWVSRSSHCFSPHTGSGQRLSLPPLPVGKAEWLQETWARGASRRLLDSATESSPCL